MITFEEIKKDPGIRTYIQKAVRKCSSSAFSQASICSFSGGVVFPSKYYAV